MKSMLPSKFLKMKYNMNEENEFRNNNIFVLSFTLFSELCILHQDNIYSAAYKMKWENHYKQSKR